MSIENTHSFSSVVSINPYKNKYKNLVSDILDETLSPGFSKKQYTISYLNTKDFIHSEISISKNVPDEDIFDAIANKAYNELGLDQAVEYEIKFVEIFSNLDEENRHFHVFIVEPEIIDSTYKQAIQEVKYIDTIIPIPLLIKTLYSKKIINENGVHCFVYFQDSDAFVAIYKDKEFLYTKSVKYSIDYLYDEFCELFGEQIHKEEFISFISTKNLKTSKSEYKEYLIKLYKEIFSGINEVLTFAKRAYELEKIDKIFIDFQIPTVTKLDEMIEVELGIRSRSFDFDFGFKSNGRFTDHVHAMMHIYSGMSDNERYDCNFTQYERPPKFTKRHSGKVIMLVAASIVVAFAYPVAYWVLSYAQIFQLDSLDKEYSDLHVKRIQREVDIKKRQADKEKALTLMKEEVKEFNSKKNTLVKIHDVQVNYPMKAEIIATFTKELNDYNVKLDRIKYEEDKDNKEFNLSLVASSDKKITNLIKHLTKTYGKNYDFSIKKIYFNEESKKYFSDLRVVLL
jgi:hypothetical protein